jgi:hypothetical protein
MCIDYWHYVKASAYIALGIILGVVQTTHLYGRFTCCVYIKVRTYGITCILKGGKTNRPQSTIFAVHVKTNQCIDTRQNEAEKNQCNKVKPVFTGQV